MNRICKKCAEHNGGKWMDDIIATAEYGKCDCCGDITTILHRHYWKGLPKAHEIKNPLKEKIVVKNKTTKSKKTETAKSVLS